MVDKNVSTELEVFKLNLLTMSYEEKVMAGKDAAAERVIIVVRLIPNMNAEEEQVFCLPQFKKGRRKRSRHMQ